MGKLTHRRRVRPGSQKKVTQKNNNKVRACVEGPNKVSKQLYITKVTLIMTYHTYIPSFVLSNEYK